MYPKLSIYWPTRQKCLEQIWYHFCLCFPKHLTGTEQYLTDKELLSYFTWSLTTHHIIESAWIFNPTVTSICTTSNRSSVQCHNTIQWVQGTVQYWFVKEIKVKWSKIWLPEWIFPLHQKALSRWATLDSLYHVTRFLSYILHCTVLHYLTAWNGNLTHARDMDNAW